VASRHAAISLLAAALLLVALPPFLAPSARAAQLAIFESVDVPFVDGPTAYVFKNQDLAQSFTASMSYRLVRVDVMVHDLDIDVPIDPLDLTIETDAGGLPGGTVLATGRADGDFGYDWLTLDLSPPVNLTVGQVYWIVLQDNNDMNQQSGYKWAVKPGDVYTGGSGAIRTGGGSWSPFGSDDFLFRNWGLEGPLIEGAMVADFATAGAYDPITFRVFFNNSGTKPASYVWTNLTLSANLTYESDTAAAAGGLTLGPLSWQFTDATVGPHTFQVLTSVGPGVFDGLPMQSTLTVDYANETDEKQETTNVTVTVVARAPGITIAKSANPRFLVPGENLTYTVTLVNSGSRASSYVWVNDTTPPEFEYAGNTAITLGNYSGEWWDGATLHVNFTDLPRGSFSFDIRGRARPGLLNGTAFTNTAEVRFTDNRGMVFDPGASASVTVRVNGASIQVGKTANVQATGPGQEIRYRIRYDNRGNAPARWLWINDTLPPEVSYVSDTGGGTPSGSVVRFAYQNVSVGAHSLTIVVRLDNATPDGQTVRNVADLSYTDSDASPALPSTATADVLVVRPYLAISLAGAAQADPGDLYDLTIGVENLGNASAPGAWVNLTIGAGLMRGADDAGTHGGLPTPEGWYFPDVSPGGFFFTAQFRVVAGLSDGTSLRTDLAASYVDALGRIAQANAASHTVVVTAPAFALVLALNRESASLGEPVELSVAYTNDGAGTAAHVWINATVPDGVEVASASDPWIATTGLTYTWHFVGVSPGARELRVTLRPDASMSPGPISVSVELTWTDANENLVGTRSSSTGFEAISVSWNLQVWGLLALLGIVAILSSFIGYRVYGLGVRNKGEILQLFVLHKSGLLIKHYTRHLHGALDTDILAAMIVAVQNFVRESFNFKAGDLEEMAFGEHKILLVHGENVILAAVVAGQFLDRIKSDLRSGILSLEGNFGRELREWSGVVDDLDGMDEILDHVLRGKGNGTAHRNGRNGRNGPSGPNGGARSPSR